MSSLLPPKLKAVSTRVGATVVASLVARYRTAQSFTVYNCLGRGVVAGWLVIPCGSVEASITSVWLWRCVAITSMRRLA